MIKCNVTHISQQPPSMYRAKNREVAGRATTMTRSAKSRRKRKGKMKIKMGMRAGR
tara:strand:- start:1517 stop:1684 length:168 start_codon:yes stop_codon:yes gene_type:complete